MSVVAPRRWNRKRSQSEATTVSAIEIALGSSLQIILFVVPVLTLLSLLFTPMSIVFTPFELVSVTGAVLIANSVAGDGESNWLEGFQLITVYIIIGAAFFFV